MEKERIDYKIEILSAWENLEISSDFLFGKVMQDAGLCREMLQRILPHLEIDHVEYTELQKGIKLDAAAKSVRLDVYVRDGKGTIYDVEIQVADTRELPKRTRYYQSMIDLQMLDKGQDYEELKPSYVIFICLFDIFGKGRHIYTFENICREDMDIALGDGTTKIFLNTDSEQEDVSRELRAFLDYVGGKISDDPFVRKLDEAVKEARKNRNWRREYMTLQMRDRENIRKGIEEGIEKGRIYGMISAFREVGMSDEEIVGRLMERFYLTETVAKEYMEAECYL